MARCITVVLTAILLAGGALGCNKKKEDPQRSPTSVNMREILKAIQNFAAANGNRLPKDLDEMVTLERSVLVNPANPSRRPGYIYIRFDRTDTPRSLQNPIVVYEAVDAWRDGASVGFMDGTVQYITDQAEFNKRVKESEEAAAAETK